MGDIYVYTVYFVVLAITNVVYKYVLNKDNKIEYYFFQKDRVKYNILKYCRIFVNIVMFIYLRFVLLNLINSYKTSK